MRTGGGGGLKSGNLCVRTNEWPLSVKGKRHIMKCEVTHTDIARCRKIDANIDSRLQHYRLVPEARA